MRQTQLVELHLFSVFKRICDEHSLKYWLTGGTLLGAVRHNGFVPWDDDLDVMILEEDYRRFVKYAKDELPDDVYLELPENNLRMENHITRLRDNYSWGLVRREKRLLINDHHGICIDIFPVRECGNACRMSKWLLRRWASIYGYYKRACFNEVSVPNLLSKWWLRFKTFVVRTLFEVMQLPYSRRYYVMHSWFINDRLWWPKDWLVREGENARRVQFEGLDVPIPYEAEKILKMWYGDWRKLPSQKDRVGYLSLALPFTPCFHASAMSYGSIHD